jgi:hypothetical protein
MLSMMTPAEVNAAKAELRPLAGTGAGAFAREGVRAAFRPDGIAALALPRIRCSAAAASQGYEPAGSASRARKASFAPVSSMLAAAMQAGAVEGGLVHTGPAQGSAVKTGSGQRGTTQNFNQTTLIPVIPGGLGPHPAREPEPV